LAGGTASLRQPLIPTSPPPLPHRLLLLLFPLLAPLLAVLLVAAINPRPSISLRLLTWRSPALPLGIWMASAAITGAALSGTASTLALWQPASSRRRRGEHAEPVREPWEGDKAGWNAEPRGRPMPRMDTAAAAPDRVPGDPSPTVSVPFRVIRRAEAPAPGPSRPFDAEAEPVAVATVVGDDWQTPAHEDW